MSVDLLSIPVADVDSHVSEPPDLWTSRMSAKFRDIAPRVVWDERGGELRWKVGDILLSGEGEYCVADWPERFPSHPASLDEANPATYEPKARLAAMDATGVRAQVLYPNIIGFDSHAVLKGVGPEAATDCVRAYNDFIAEFAAEDPARLIPVAMVPYWDLEASVREIHRVHELGHRGLLMGALLRRLGLPNLSSEQWDPVLATAQELELSINLHVGFNMRDDNTSGKLHEMLTKNALAQRMNRASFVINTAALGASSCMEAAADLIMRGACARFPRLKFVSVESGFGYWPYLLDHMDWFWNTSGAIDEFPDRDLPSEYWMRQFYATFWFERRSLGMLPDFQDNVMFETDYPHETSLSPGRWPHSTTAKDAIEANLSSTPTAVARKVLWENAATLYRIPTPA